MQEIPLALRFIVKARVRVRCVLCAASPSRLRSQPTGARVQCVFSHLNLQQASRMWVCGKCSGV